MSILWAQDGAEVKAGAREGRGEVKETHSAFFLSPKDVSSHLQAWKKRQPERMSLECVPLLGGLFG